MYIKDIPELVSVIESENVVTVQAGNLRNLFGHGKLKCHVRSKITVQLFKMGIRHYPSGEFPSNQYEFVRLVKIGSEAEKLHDAVFGILPENDEAVKDFVSGRVDALVDKVTQRVKQELRLPQ